MSYPYGSPEEDWPNDLRDASDEDVDNWCLSDYEREREDAKRERERRIEAGFWMTER